MVEFSVAWDKITLEELRDLIGELGAEAYADGDRRTIRVKYALRSSDRYE